MGNTIENRGHLLYAWTYLMADLVHNTTKHNLILSKESSYLSLGIRLFQCKCVWICVRVHVFVCARVRVSLSLSQHNHSQKWAKNKPTTLKHCIVMYRIGSIISKVNLLTCSSLESKCRLPAHAYQKIQSLKE